MNATRRPLRIHPERLRISSDQQSKSLAPDLRVLGETLAEGDGAAIEQAELIELTAVRDAEFLFFASA